MPSLRERLDGFGAAVLDPSLPAPDGLVGPDGVPSARRFAVYRNNVVVGLSEALQAGFPRVARIVGDEFFHAMARVFVAMHPPVTPVLLDYGAAFPDFLGGFAPAASLAYLPDVARIERAATEAYHACDAAPLGWAAFAAVPAARTPELRLRLHPSAHVLRSSMPAFTIWRMNAADAAPQPVDLAVPEDTLIVRPDAQVEVQRLAPGGFEFVCAIGRGATLAQSLAAALASAPAFDLAAHLSHLIALGTFSALFDDDDDRSRDRA